MASTFERVSTTSTGGQADGESSLTSDVGNNVGEAVTPVVFSADGNEIVFISSAPDITGDGSSQAVIKNLTTGVDTLETGSGDITTAASAAFTPDGSKLVIEGFSNGGQQIFEKNPTSGTTTLVSSDNTGAAGNGESSALAVSTNGDRVAFSSSSSNLVTAQASGNSDFVKDVGTGAIVQLGDGDTGTASSDGFSFTSNLSEAVYTNEADDESGPPPEVYAENLTTGAKTLVSGAAGVASNKGGFDGVLLANGTQVAFNSESTNLVAGAPSGGVFVKNLTTNAITTVLANQVTTAGNETSGTAYELVAASPDSRNLAYETFVGNQVNAADGSNHGTATTQISVTNLNSGATVDVTPSATYTFTGGPGAITDPGYESPFGPSADSQAGTINGTIYGGVVYSPDGTKIAFSKEIYTNYSYDFSATPPTQSGTLSTQVFVYDTQSGATKAVTSMATDNVGTKSGSFYSGVSFSPNSQDVVVDENTVGGTGSQTIVTNLTSGTQTTVPVDSDQVFVSPTGPLVAFTSSDALVPDDTNGDSDVYVVPVCFALGTRIRDGRRGCRSGESRRWRSRGNRIRQPSPDQVAGPPHGRLSEPCGARACPTGPHRRARFRSEAARPRPHRLAGPRDLRRRPWRGPDTCRPARQRLDHSAGRGRRGHILARRTRRPRHPAGGEPSGGELHGHGQPAHSSPGAPWWTSTPRQRCGWRPMPNSAGRLLTEGRCLRR